MQITEINKLPVTGYAYPWLGLAIDENQVLLQRLVHIPPMALTTLRKFLKDYGRRS